MTQKTRTNLKAGWVIAIADAGNNSAEDVRDELDNVADSSFVLSTDDSDDITEGSVNLLLTTTERTKLSGIETSADVTDTANVTSAGALMDSEVDADIKTLVLPASVTISAFGATLVDDANAAAARGTIGLDTSDNVEFDAITASSIAVANAGISIQDTFADHSLTFRVAEDLTAARTLEFVVNDAAARLDVTGTVALTSTNTGDSPTLVNLITSSVSTDNSSLSLEDQGGGNFLVVGSGETLTADRVLSFVVNDAGATISVTGSAAISGTNTGDQTATGRVLLATATASASASINFTSDIDSTYDVYEFVFTNVVPATDSAELLVRTDASGGASFDAGASDYAYCFLRAASTSSSAIMRNSTGATSINISPEPGVVGWGNAASESVSGRLYLYAPSVSTDTNIDFVVSGVTSASSRDTLIGGGKRSSAGAVNALQFLFSTGNITSGEFQLFGIRSS